MTISRQTQINSRRIQTFFLAVFIVLAVFFIASYHLTRESLWYDEGWTMWAVYDNTPASTSISEAVQVVRGSLTTTLDRVRNDVHPPLYFLLLDGWLWATGDSVFAVRLLSVFFALIGLAGTYTVGSQLFDRSIGLMAMVVLGTASFFVYYTREARMYTLLLAVGVLATWAYGRWIRCPNKRYTLVYALLLALLLYTHYAGALIVLTHGLHLLLTRPRAVRWLKLSLPYVLAVVFYIPWIPVLLTQIRVNDGRPMAQVLPTDWGVVAALLLILTSGNWGQYVLPFVLGRALPEIRWHGRALLLILLWLLVTPVALLALNAWVTPVFQIRYAMAILPAGALLMAYGLRHVGLPAGVVGSRWVNPVRIGLTAFLLLWLAYTQLAMYTQFWPDKPRWNEAAQQMVAARQPLEPVLMDINPSSVMAYYDRQYGIRQGVTVDVAWYDPTPEAMSTLVEKLEAAPSVWAVMRSDRPSTWDAISALSNGRSVGYRDSVMNVIVYRFDQTASDPDDLRFSFGDSWQVDSGIGHHFYARRGESFCLPVDIQLTALQPPSGDDSVKLLLTQGYNALRTQWEQALPDSEKPVVLSPCLNIPADTPLGPHHLRLVIEQQQRRLPVIEGSTASDLYWGTELMLATVSVDDE